MQLQKYGYLKPKQSNVRLKEGFVPGSYTSPMASLPSTTSTPDILNWRYGKSTRYLGGLPVCRGDCRSNMHLKRSKAFLWGQKKLCSRRSHT
mmetsp:Transcript_23458/g.42329  ORF Transcript_23458/g.42329 Transcript_23458/m.42329 type:complete len:92 (+) Transcript_23458:98-373(+)